jgi:hypothetical protein
MTSTSPPAGEMPAQAQATTAGMPGYSSPSLAMIYPSHNPERPVAVAVQRDGVLSIVQIDIAHASGLLTALAGILQQHLEAERRR